MAEVNIDNIATDLNLKLSKTECVRYPISKWLSSDGLTWYTIYNDGWKECGGQATGVAYNSSGRFSFPLPNGFSNNKYTIVGSVVTANTDHYFRGVYFVEDTGTQAKACTSYNGANSGAYTIRYYACGY